MSKTNKNKKNIHKRTNTIIAKRSINTNIGIATLINIRNTIIEDMAVQVKVGTVKVVAVEVEAEAEAKKVHKALLNKK